MKYNIITGYIETEAGPVPQVSPYLLPKDRLGTVLARWSVGRNNYKIKAGIYALGTPDKNSHVLVTANYKLTFDTLRKNLTGLNVWLLVLDTKGVNVWCVAGKGTFSTKELVDKIKQVSLDRIVNHKRIILPQLGAVGVAAHSVKCSSGFTVIYGPVRAKDIPEFLDKHFKASDEMRRVKFDLIDRLILVPVDFVYRLGYLLAVFILILIAAGITNEGISFSKAIVNGLPVIRNIFAGYVAGIVVTPILLPYIPVRSFALKGFLTGLVMAALLWKVNLLESSTIGIIGWLLFIPGLASFMAMNFTGSSTYTSLSGVKKEMKAAVPAQIILGVTSIVLIVIGKLF